MNVVGFTAEADSLYAHDEFWVLAALYTLCHGEAAAGKRQGLRKSGKMNLV
ncbi:hypothetical protein O9993_16590 [Vibrio lentus]|nr:hypothetical protein [Vibrio lentus]